LHKSGGRVLGAEKPANKPKLFAGFLVFNARK